MSYETEIKESTRVTFPAGETTGRGIVLFAARSPEGIVLVTDQTPVHPVSFRWPDQASDMGKISTSGDSYRMTGALTGLANAETGELLIGDAAKALGRVGSEWVSVVCHLLEDAGSDLPAIGSDVVFEVDIERRAQLSAAHTAVHLSAFALNRAMAKFWTKEGVGLDSLGAPDFDKEAIESSHVAWEGSKDTYRIGKSLRKKGFDGAAAMAALSDVADEVNATIATWLSRPSPIALEPSEATLDTRRLWRCELDGRSAEMFCAGTHVEDISVLKNVTVEMTTNEDGFAMTTTVNAKT